MNRFSEQWRDDQERQMKQKLDLASRLEEVGVTISEPEKFKLEDLQELNNKHYVTVKKIRLEKNRYLNYREIAELAGVKYNTFLSRIRNGYSLEKAILGEPENYLTYKEIAELAGVVYPTFVWRINNGYSLEEAIIGKPTRKKIAEPAGVPVRKSENDRRERKKRRMEILMHLNALEQKNGDPEIIAKLERELANV